MSQLLKDYAIGILILGAAAATVGLLSLLLHWTWRILCWGVCTSMGWLAGPEDAE